MYKTLYNILKFEKREGYASIKLLLHIPNMHKLIFSFNYFIHSFIQSFIQKKLNEFFPGVLGFFVSWQFGSCYSWIAQKGDVTGRIAPLFLIGCGAGSMVRFG